MAVKSAERGMAVVRNRVIVAASALFVVLVLWALAAFVPAWINSQPRSAPDDEFGSVDIYHVDDEGSLHPAATGLAAEVWETFVRVTTPEFAGAVVNTYRVSDSPDSDTLAYVQQNFEPEYWTLAANLATSEDRTQLIATLVHEYAHILSLASSEVVPRVHPCATLSLTEGCATETSVIWAFDERFWQGYGEDAPTPDNADADLAWDFYQAHEDEFVSDYAATNVVEDFAESFMTWVIEDDSAGDSVAASKLAFFTDYPDYVAIRDRIRAEFTDELGLAQ